MSTWGPGMNQFRRYRAPKNDLEWIRWNDFIGKNCGEIFYVVHQIIAGSVMNAIPLRFGESHKMDSVFVRSLDGTAAWIH